MEVLFSAEAFKYKNSFVIKYIPPNPIGVYVCFHGFPGWLSKNNDIAERLCLSGYITYLIHYEGLGLSDGSFNFEKCIKTTGDFLNLIKETHSDYKISFLGHSFGGYLAVFYSEFISDRLILLAPLILFPNDVELKTLTDKLVINYPYETQIYGKDLLYYEFKKLNFDLLNKHSLNNVFSRTTLLIHGLQDVVLSSNLSSMLQAYSTKGVFKYVEIEDDHVFTSKRREIIKIIDIWHCK
jgi:predicted esterase YcpF (UPF0227 family)